MVRGCPCPHAGLTGTRDAEFCRNGVLRRGRGRRVALDPYACDPEAADNFPLDILVANLVASFVLGLVTVLCRRHIVSDGINLLVGTGIAGGLSTFSSFAYGTVVLMSGSAASLVVASAYVLIGLFLGYVAVVCGQQVARSLFP